MKTIKVYTFDELDEDAQDRAIEDHAQFLSEVWECDWDLNHNEVLVEHGFENAKPGFSGFDGQGDGASFTAQVNLLVFLEKMGLKDSFPRIIEEITDGYQETGFSIIRNSYRYYHHLTMGVEENDHSAYFEDIFDEKIEEMYENASEDELEALDELVGSMVNEASKEYDKEYEDIQEIILSKAHDLAQDIYYNLRADYEAQSEREYVIDSIRANEYTFFEDGKFCPY
jgi:hypothetical protein